MSAKLVGEVFGIGPEGINGWAWDENKPYDAVEVEFLIGNRIVHTVVADRFNKDLIARKIGNGMHGFSVKLGQARKEKLPFRVLCRTRSAQEVIGEVSVVTASDLKAIVESGVVHDYEGHVSGIHNSRFEGWAFDRLSAATPLTIEIFDGEDFVSSIVADRFRRDLFEAEKGKGYCAFSADVPASVLDGRIHSYAFRVKGSNFYLNGSPVSFGPAHLQGIHQAISNLSDRVDRLAARIGEIAGGEHPDQGQLLKDIMLRVDAKLAIYRTMSLKETTSDPLSQSENRGDKPMNLDANVPSTGPQREIDMFVIKKVRKKNADPQ